MLNIVNNKTLQKITIFTIVILFFISSMILTKMIIETYRYEEVEIISIKAKKLEKSASNQNKAIKVLLNFDKQHEEVILEENKEDYVEIPVNDVKLEMEENKPTAVITNVSQEEIISQEKSESEKNIENVVETQYDGYTTIGKIEIPKTRVNTPIIDGVTVDGMKIAPCFLYSTGEFNVNGNSYIVGHNYCNGKLFSNNNLLQLGDKIYITSLDGNQKEYIVYSKFITDENDTSYLKRKIGESPEITLQCCTDDESGRIIILAKAE